MVDLWEHRELVIKAYREEALSARDMHINKSPSWRLFFDDNHQEDLEYVHACALTDNLLWEIEHA